MNKAHEEVEITIGLLNQNYSVDMPEQKQNLYFYIIHFTDFSSIVLLRIPTVIVIVSAGVLHKN